VSGTGERQVALPIGGSEDQCRGLNKKWQKDVADAGGKLLSLAIELKADLEQYSHVP